MYKRQKFLRGFSYYHLLTTFGGVPLRNTIPSLKSLSIPRATEEEIAAQIESDWKDAIGGLTETADAGKASGLAAHAYLAKLYWYLACQGKQASGNKTYWELALEPVSYTHLGWKAMIEQTRNLYEGYRGFKIRIGLISSDSEMCIRDRCITLPD